jgi:hypothetical protein
VIGEWPGMIGLGSLGGQSLWFSGQVKEVSNDYDGPGLNHLAFAAASVADVDESVAWLQARGVAALFETPRHRPDFSADEAEHLLSGDVRDAGSHPGGDRLHRAKIEGIE